MDYAQTITLLKVNGLSLENTPDEIRIFLRKANYTEPDIDQFLAAVVTAKGATPASAPVPPPPATFPSAVPTNSASSVNPFPPEPTAPVAPIVQPAPLPAKKSKVGFFVALGIVVLIPLCIGGYVAYAMFGVSPEQGALSAIKASVAGKKFHIDMDIHNTASAADQQMKVTAAADVDVSDKTAIKMDLKPKIDSSLFSGSGEIRVFGQTFYGKLDSMSFLGMTMNGSTTGTWYKVTKDDINSFATSRGLGAAGQITQVTDEATAQAKLDAFFASGAFTSSGPAKLGIHNGRPVLMYTFTIDSEKLKAWEASNNSGVTPPASAFASLSTVTYSPLVITKDLVSGNLVSVDFGVTSTMKNPYMSKETSSTYVYHAEYTQLANVTIEEPKDAVPFTALMSSLPGSSLGTNPYAPGAGAVPTPGDPKLMGKDAALKATMHDLAVQAVLYQDAYNNSFGTLSPTASCAVAESSGTSLFSATKVKADLTTVAALTSSKTCRVSSDGKNFAVSAALLAKPGTWFCVDSKGSIKETTGDPISGAGDTSC